MGYKSERVRALEEATRNAMKRASKLNTQPAEVTQEALMRARQMDGAAVWGNSGDITNVFERFPEVPDGEPMRQVLWHRDEVNVEAWTLWT